MDKLLYKELDKTRIPEKESIYKIETFPINNGQRYLVKFTYIEEHYGLKFLEEKDIFINLDKKKKLEETNPYKEKIIKFLKDNDAQKKYDSTLKKFQKNFSRKTISPYGKQKLPYAELITDRKNEKILEEYNSNFNTNYEAA